MLLGTIFRMTSRGLEPVVPEALARPSTSTWNRPILKHTSAIVPASVRAMVVVIMNQPMVLPAMRPKVRASLTSQIAITTEENTMGTMTSCSARINS